ncbi:MAG: glycosyltransferase family 39 protein [Nitrospirota bacterium]
MSFSHGPDKSLYKSLYQTIIPYQVPFIALALLLLATSLYDLTSAQFSAPTIMRQAQTAMLSENFAREGFRLQGLYLNIHGHDRPVMAYEFPVYNAIVGILFLAINFSPIWGKLISVLASVLALYFFATLVSRRYGQQVTLFAGVFFLLSPLTIMMQSAFQPDALAVMFTLSALLVLDRWHRDNSYPSLVLFSLLLLLGGLTKYPALVPFGPVMILAFFSKNGRFRTPRLLELFIIIVLFAVPLVLWYTYRAQITHSDFGTTGMNSMFLFGDLKRFLSPAYYITPLYIISVLACSGMGALFLLFGLFTRSPLNIAMALGIPLFFLVIPTASEQHYYFFPCIPLVALIMARGAVRFNELCGQRDIVLLKYATYSLYALACFSLALYIMVLRQDNVMYDAAKTVNRVSAPQDLIFVMNMHNRTNGFGGNNPTLFYLSGRKGWNITNTFTLETSLAQIEKRREQGAKWVVITWYTPDLETVLEPYIPKSAHTRIDPGIDGKHYYQELKKRYTIEFESKNYAVLKLF